MSTIYIYTYTLIYICRCTPGTWPVLGIVSMNAPAWINGRMARAGKLQSKGYVHMCMNKSMTIYDYMYIVYTQIHKQRIICTYMYITE